jgi:hypothetical protein
MATFGMDRIRHTRRIILYCLLASLAVAAATALARPALLRTPKHRSDRLGKTKHAGSVLLGDQNIESSARRAPARSPEAFSFVARISGTARSISVYVDRSSQATSLIAGLYFDSEGHPGSLAGAGYITSPQARAWNTVALRRTPIVRAGRTYWVAVLGRNGRLDLRERRRRLADGGKCNSEISNRTGLTWLPSSWGRGPQGTSCPISAYVRGTPSGPAVPPSASTGTPSGPAVPPSASTAPAPPANRAAPSIGGKPQQGQTLTASNGMWTGDTPMSFSCVWSDGTQGCSDTLSASDVGQNVSVTVTARNDAGSATASSQPVGPVTASAGGGSGGMYQLPADRTYDWNPGLNAVGGIPDANWAVYKTISPSGGDDTATIQAALDSCPKDGVVQLAAGVFHISGQGLSIENSYCVLRGVGPGPGNWPAGIAASGTGGTYLEKALGTNYPVAIIGPRWQEGPGGNGNGGPPATDLTSDAVRGSKSVTVASTAGLSVGALVVVNELTDPTISHIHSDDNYDLSGYMDGGNRPLGDTMEIASISGNTLTFTTDFPITYQVSQTAHLYLVTNQTNYSGIENLYVYGGEGGDGGGGIHLFNCDHCWIKHIEDTWSVGTAINVEQSFGVEIRDSYFHDCENDNLYSGGSCYGLGLNWYTSDTLIENNIIRMFNAADVMRATGGGNVMGYNYTDDIADLGGQWENNGIMASHMTTPHYELFEGNQAPNFGQDDRWGNSVYITVFRNDFFGYNSDFQAYGPQRGIGVSQWHWWQSFVGNVLGTANETWATAYEEINSSDGGWEWWLCYQSADTVPDGGKCLSTMLRDGNYDYVTKEVHWHGIGGTGVNNGLTPPADATLPDSLYLTSKPAFFGSNPWPWVDGSNASGPLPGRLPARARYDAGAPNAAQ